MIVILQVHWGQRQWLALQSTKTTLDQVFITVGQNCLGEGELFHRLIGGIYPPAEASLCFAHCLLVNFDTKINLTLNPCAFVLATPLPLFLLGAITNRLSTHFPSTTLRDCSPDQIQIPTQYPTIALPATQVEIPTRTLSRQNVGCHWHPQWIPGVGSAPPQTPANVG